MDASTRPNDTACLPHPRTFADRMISHWTKPKPEGLGNVYSAALGRLWITMGETFNAAIAGNPGTGRPVPRCRGGGCQVARPQPAMWRGEDARSQGLRCHAGEGQPRPSS